MNFWKVLKIVVTVVFLGIIGVAAYVSSDSGPTLQQQVVSGNTPKFNF